MGHHKGAVLFVLLVAACLGLAFAWPHLNDVETGKTAGYPDLKPRPYDIAPDRVYVLVREIAETTGGWKLSGHGFGPGSWSVQTARAPRPFPFVYDVHVKITRHGSRALVSIRSTSRWGKWDLGQNARNIRELFRLLDEKLRR
jgi:uncharacterized protein (DUF1499 family)